MAITGTGSTLSSLPCESLALIASQLQRPDRLSLFSSCLALRQACSLTAHCLVVPGQQLLATCHKAPSGAFSSPCSSSSPWDCACCADLDDCQACMAAGASSAEDDMTISDEEQGEDNEEDACSWLKRYSGVRCLTLTSCDSCQGGPAGVGRARALRIQGPCSPHTPTGPCSPHTPPGPCSSHTPTGYAASNRLGTSSSSFLANKPCVRSPAHRPLVSLSSFLAAAGSSMPYLQELDLSSACTCLDTPPGVLECLTRSCPLLSTLSLPTWLLQPAAQQSSSWYLWGARPGCSFDGPALKLAAATAWDPTLSAAAAFAVFEAASSPTSEPYGLDRLLLHPAHQHQPGSRSVPSSPPAQLNRLPGFPPLRGISAQQQQPQPSREHLGVLAGLCSLTSLKLCGAAPPAAALKQLSQLTQLLSFSLLITDSTPDIPAALSQLPGWQGGGVVGDASDSDSSIAAASSGALLGASLALLPGLTSLSLSGALHASDTLKALAVLPALAQVELCNLSDFAVGSLANLSGLTGLTSLRVRGCRALQATARSALPLQLQALQELEVLDLDFDLHLRDMQVLCLLKRLTHLSANSFHHCIHLMPTLSLPALRCLCIASVSRLQPQQQVQQQVQQQQGPPAGAVYAHVMAAANAAAAAAAPEAPAAVAAAGGEAGNADAVQAAAVAGVPVVPLSALPVLMNLQQQQQQPGEQPPYILLAAQGGAPALLLLHNQQHQQHAQPLAPMLQAYNAVAPMHAAALQPQQQQQQQHHIHQQLGHVSGVSLQLLQLRQQQLYLQQQQLRLQQQQVRLQLQQMQTQWVQHANPHAIAAAAAAAGAAQAPPPPPPHPAPQQQQQQQHPQQQQQQAADPAQADGAAAGAAVAGCMQSRGWLVVLFPGLEELRLTSAKDCAVALPALQGHPTLQKLVIGTAAARQAQQQQGVAPAGSAAWCAASGAAGMHSGPSSSNSMLGRQCAGLVAATSRGVSAPWGVLRTMPCLEELEILETATVLGCVFSSVGMAAAGQLVRLVLRGADSLSDFSAATLLGPYPWAKLSHLEIEGAQGLSNRGLNCLAGLPAVQSLSLSYCPSISASGLGSFLLSSSSNNLRRVNLLCCAGISPAEAQTVQDAIWAITHRRVEVSWSRHDPAQA